jgi:hypothetical protein
LLTFIQETQTMANKMRWRYGDVHPVMVGVAADSVIEIGDLVLQEASLARPASELEDLGSEAANQEAFHDDFLGVAMQHSPAGSAEPIRIATTGVFEFDCGSATFVIGDLLGVDEASSGTELEDQVVAKVATPNLAIGVCVKTVNPAASRTLVEIHSTIVRGGVQAAA